MKKKLLAVLLLALLASMAFCMSGVAFADTTYSTRVNQYVYDYANEIVKNIEKGEIKDIIPIYDTDDNVNSSCFTIHKDNEPYIYLILDNYYREGISPIIEIGFGEYYYGKDDKVVNLNYLEYGVKEKNKNQ